MKPIPCTIRYGKTEIGYELLTMNRKSLEIAVHPDKSVVVKAPSTSTMEVIEQKVRKRARWIQRQIGYFGQFDPRTPPRKYVGGESHLYLGRKYRLKIARAGQDKILLKGGYFFIEAACGRPAHIKSLLESWYRARAGAHLPKVFDDCRAAFRGERLGKPRLKLQRMQKRWGSLSSKGQLTLNVDLIRTPRECIEYVVMHELCHLVHHNHGPEFYKLLERKMPDWTKRKNKLEMVLA